MSSFDLVFVWPFKKNMQSQQQQQRALTGTQSLNIMRNLLRISVVKTRAPYLQQLLAHQKRRTEWGTAASPIIQCRKKRRVMDL